MEKIKIDNLKIELTEIEILSVVNHWHEEMHRDIFQNEYGHDLSEVCINLMDVIWLSEKD
jgi:hypothetical protein